VSEVRCLLPLDVGVGRLDAVQGEEFPNDARIRPAAVGDLVEDLADAECGFQPGLHGRLACPAGADQGAVDVEEQDAHLAILGPAGRVAPGEWFTPGAGRDR
jgi:hypothetical protein